MDWAPIPREETLGRNTTIYGKYRNVFKTNLKSRFPSIHRERWVCDVRKIGFTPTTGQRPTDWKHQLWRRRYKEYHHNATPSRLASRFGIINVSATFGIVDIRQGKPRRYTKHDGKMATVRQYIPLRCTQGVKTKKRVMWDNWIYQQFQTKYFYTFTRRHVTLQSVL